MTSDQIGKLCTDWLEENHGGQTASQYRCYSLVIPMWNAPELNETLDNLKQVLSIAFGPGELFGTTDYNEVRRKLNLPEDVPIPEAFIKAFSRAYRRSWKIVAHGG